MAQLRRNCGAAVGTMTQLNCGANRAFKKRVAAPQFGWFVRSAPRLPKKELGAPQLPRASLPMLTQDSDADLRLFRRGIEAQKPQSWEEWLAMATDPWQMPCAKCGSLMLWQPATGSPLRCQKCDPPAANADAFFKVVNNLRQWVEKPPMVFEVE